MALTSHELRRRSGEAEPSTVRAATFALMLFLLSSSLPPSLALLRHRGLTGRAAGTMPVRVPCLPCVRTH